MGDTRWIGSEIRPLRTALGWTQARLAAELGVDPASVWRWEHGRANPQRVIWRLLWNLEARVRPREMQGD